MKRIAFLTLLICASCLEPQDRLIGTLSDPSVELMAHCFRYVGEYDGWRYGLYNAGYESTVEHPKNLDIDLKLCRWKTGDVENREVCQIWRTAQGICDNFRPPYDATGIIDGSTLHILVCPGVDGRSTYIHVPYYLNKKELGKEEVMTVDGAPITVTNVLDNYTARTGVKIPWFTDGGPESAFGIGMNVEIARHGEYYYSVISACAGGFTSMIVRTTDLIHWETVAIPRFSSVTSASTFWEGVVRPLHDDIFAFSARLQSEDGVIYGTWNSSTGELSNLQLIEGGITARPEFFEYKGRTYLYCNTYGPSNVEGYGSVYRSTASFYKISKDGASLEFVRKKFVPEGIHYPTFYVDRGLYIIYSTDSRHLNPNEGRSNIAIERIVL